jgi:hypothetical protein
MSTISFSELSRTLSPTAVSRKTKQKTLETNATLLFSYKYLEAVSKVVSCEE